MQSAGIGERHVGLDSRRGQPSEMESPSSQEVQEVTSALGFPGGR